MAKPAPPVDADQDTAEETADAPHASNWETIYLLTSVLMLLAATVVVLYAAGSKYNVGIFKQGG